MKKILQPALMAVMLLGVGAAQAQVTFGPKVGINYSSLKQTLSDDAKKPSNAKATDFNGKIGASFGIMANMRFGNLALQPAITYSMKGAKVDDERTTTSTTSGITTSTKSTQTGSFSLGYVDIPVNLVYTTGGDNGFQVFVGPYVGLGLSGKYDFKDSYTSTTSGGGISLTSTVNTDGKGDIEFNGSPTDAEAEKAFNEKKVLFGGLDYGLNVGIGYLINNIQIQAGYGLGLSNIEPKYTDQKDSERGTLKNNVISLTAAYHFGGN